MLQGTTTYRVRYADTDQMGYLYYGHYARMYEIGRSELLRSTGITYQQCEDDYRIMMPVLEMNSRYKLPALYDQLLTIHSALKELPRRLLHFHHEIYNEEEQLLHTGEVKLFYVDMNTNKPVSCPSFLLERFSKHF